MNSLKNKKILLGLIFLVTYFSANACDICSILDYGNVNNKTFIALDYRYSLIRGYNSPIPERTTTSTNSSRLSAPNLHRALPGSDLVFLNSEADFELRTSYNLTFNYTLKERWNLGLVIPYVVNLDFFDQVINLVGPTTSDLERFNGIGDVKIRAERIFNNKNEAAKFNKILKLGGALSLPTGKFQVENIITDNVDIQPGRDIYALDFSASYNIERKGLWGANASFNHYRPLNRRINNFNFTYQFANEYSVQTTGYKIFNGAIKKILILGLRGENQGQESIDEIQITNTGFNALFINTGLTISWRNFLLRGDVNIPIYQQLNGLQLKNRVNFNTGINYYFKNKKEDKEK